MNPNEGPEIVFANRKIRRAEKVATRRAVRRRQRRRATFLRTTTEKLRRARFLPREENAKTLRVYGDWKKRLVEYGVEPEAAKRFARILSGRPL